MTIRAPLLVAIVGGSGAGKTWLAEKLEARLRRKAVRLSLDNFYRDRSHLPSARRAKLNFDHPRAIDWASFKKAIRDLRAGQATRIPSYDFSTHCRGSQVSVVKSKPIILVDGLWLLRNPALRRLFELKVFLDCPAQMRLRRRLGRDVQSRGRDKRSIRKQFRETVEPMYQRFVAPQARWADIVLRANYDARDVERIANLLLRKMPGRLSP